MEKNIKSSEAEHLIHCSQPPPSSSPPACHEIKNNSHLLALVANTFKERNSGIPGMSSRLYKLIPTQIKENSTQKAGPCPKS